MNLKIIAILILLSMFAGTYYAGKSSGYNECKSEISDSKDEAEEEDQADVNTLIDKRKEGKTVYVTKIKYIKAVQDKTGCADTKLIDMGFRLQ